MTMSTVEAIDLWIETMEIDPTTVWGPLEERASELGVTLDYYVEEYLV